MKFTVRDSEMIRAAIREEFRSQVEESDKKFEFKVLDQDRWWVSGHMDASKLVGAIITKFTYHYDVAEELTRKELFNPGPGKTAKGSKE